MPLLTLRDPLKFGWWDEVVVLWSDGVRMVGKSGLKSDIKLLGHMVAGVQHCQWNAPNRVLTLQVNPTT